MSGSARASSLASKKKGSQRGVTDRQTVSPGTGPLNRQWNKTREQFNSSNKRNFTTQIPEGAGWW